MTFTTMPCRVHWKKWIILLYGVHVLCNDYLLCASYMSYIPQLSSCHVSSSFPCALPPSVQNNTIHPMYVAKINMHSPVWFHPVQCWPAFLLLLWDETDSLPVVDGLLDLRAFGNNWTLYSKERNECGRHNFMNLYLGSCYYLLGQALPMERMNELENGKDHCTCRNGFTKCTKIM